MESLLLPILLFAGCALALAVGLLTIGSILGPKRSGRVKEMPYVSGLDPIHDARRRFDVRVHLVAIAFLVFDVELLFLYPWAVANKDPQGLRLIADANPNVSLTVIFADMLFFVLLLAVGLVYAWRKGVFRWR